MKKTLPIIIIIIIVAIAAAVHITGGKKEYTETITVTKVGMDTTFSTVEIVDFMTITETITLTTTETIVKSETTVINGSTTIITTTYLNNITFTTVTEIITYYYGNDGLPNIVTYIPKTINSLNIIVNLSLTTVYYPEKYSNLYTPILPVFIFYDIEYYAQLTKSLKVTKIPENPPDYITILSKIKENIAIVKTWSYPTYLHVAIENSTMNEIELAHYFAGVAILNSKTPTIIYCSNILSSTIGVAVNGKVIMGTHMFGNTEAAKIYYYNVLSNHIEYYGVVNPNAPTLTISEETIANTHDLFGMRKTTTSYIITETIRIRSETYIHTITGTVSSLWGSYAKTDALGNTITAFVSNSIIYIITNTFTTTTLPAYPANITKIFIPLALREFDLYYYGKSTIFFGVYDSTSSIWYAVTVKGNYATGTFYNKHGESIGSYDAVLSSV